MGKMEEREGGAAAASGEVVFDPAMRWWTGRINRLEEVRAGGSIQGPVHFLDCTLREGEESPDVFLTDDDRLRIVEQLLAAGIREFEVGYPGSVPQHARTAALIKKRYPQAVVGGISRTYLKSEEWRDDIMRALDAGVTVLSFVGIASSSISLTTPWLKSERIADRVAECIACAKSQGAFATFSLAAITKTDLEAVAAIHRSAAQAGVDRLSISDSTGGATPEAMRFLVRLVRDEVGGNVPIAVHCHNTFGLAVANTLASLQAGASIVEAVPLGLGEGAGVAPLEEVAFALEVLYGVPTGLKVEKIADACATVAAAAGMSLWPHKPLLGRNIYRHQIDSHVAAMLRGAWYSWETVRPDVVGQGRSIEYARGKIAATQSGAIATMLGSLGLDPTPERVRLAYKAVTEALGDRNWLTQEEAERVIKGTITEGS